MEMKAKVSFEIRISIYQTTRYHIPKCSNPDNAMGTRCGEILLPGLRMPFIQYRMLKKSVDSLI
jgi:hypothetical protein